MNRGLRLSKATCLEFVSFDTMTHLKSEEKKERFESYATVMFWLAFAVMIVGEVFFRPGEFMDLDFSNTESLVDVFAEYQEKQMIHKAFMVSAIVMAVVGAGLRAWGRRSAKNN